MFKSVFILILLIVTTTFINAQVMAYKHFEYNGHQSTITTDQPTSSTAKDVNPLLAKWIGPYGGVPAFDKVVVSDFLPAAKIAIEESLAELDKIANNPQKPTFENTFVSMENSGKALKSLFTYYFVWSSNKNSAEFRVVESEAQPLFSEYRSKVIANDKLFNRIEQIYQSPEYKALTAEQQRLVWNEYTSMVRSGAKLSPDDKKKLADINQQLSKNFTQFSQNLLADESDVVLVLDSEADLVGLSSSQIDGAATAAGSKYPGKWVIKNTRSFVDPFLTYSTRRDLREKAWKMFINRGDNGDQNDNNKIISEILALRAQRANLLGFETHAHWRLQNSMAKTPEAAMELLEAVWKPAVERVDEEVAEMQKLADAEGANIKIQPWDYHYYMEKVRKDKFDLDQNEIKQYLQLENLRDGMFWVAEQIFNLQFTPIHDVPVFHPDVKVWKVTDVINGAHVGLFYFDPYAREGKRSGAWMNAYRTQHKIDGQVTTIVSNNSNFVKGKEGEPVLISWDDASTLFHEFGHALHGLSSNVTYPSLSGTNVVRDYVEFPSQLLEYWLATPEVLNKFALHYQTGKPIPQELVDKINNASTFMEGFNTTEFLASALIDMKLHLAGNKPIDPDKFERETLAELGMPDELVMRHRTPQFGHIFSSDSYSAGYYSYLWADVLTADAYNAFIETSGPYDKEVANRLIKYVFSVGNTVDPAEGYRQFRGRDPKVEALMLKRGFH